MPSERLTAQGRGRIARMAEKRRSGCLLLAALLLAQPQSAWATGARTTYLYGADGALQGRLVETPDGRSATLYAPNGKTERLYRRTPNGWDVRGPGGEDLGRAVTPGQQGPR